MKNPISLIGDIGGTHIRLAIYQHSDEQILCVKTYRCADFAHLDNALTHYMTHDALITTGDIESLCLAVPGTTHQDKIELPNSHWIADRHRLSGIFTCSVFLINDFTAQALAISSLNNNEIKWLRDSRNEKSSSFTKLIMGPGTGLGVAALLPEGQIVDSEGGHVSFAPVSDLQIEILKVLSKIYYRVSVERLLSGPGIANIYLALQEIFVSTPGFSEKKDDDENTILTAEKVYSLALQGDQLCKKTIAEFCRILGSVCGDAALSFGALGGVYLSGGILNKLEGLFNTTDFLECFNNKGRYENYCQSIPIALITAPQPGLIGAANYLSKKI
ncbi:MAG: glucokinase [Cellvibrionaceae bacterium]